MTIFINAGLMAVLIGAGYFFSKSLPLKKHFFPALAIKIFAGLVIGWLYWTYYGHGDTIVYYQESLKAHEAINQKEDLLDFVVKGTIPEYAEGIICCERQPRTRFMIRIVTGLGWAFGPGYYWIATWFSLFSFLGMWLVANRIAIGFPKLKLAALIGFLYFPSVVMWSSGLTKESLAMGSLSLAIWALINLPGERPTRRGIFHGLVFILSFILLWKVKYFYAGLFAGLLPGLFITSIALKKQWLPKKFQMLIWAGITILTFVVVNFSHINFRFDRVSEVIMLNHDGLVEMSRPDNIIHYKDLDGSFSALVTNTPKAVFSGLFRPLPWEGGNMLKLASGIENLLLMLMVLAALFSLRKTRIEQQVLFWTVLTYIVLLAWIIAFTTPNLGTLVRYKVGFLPFLILFTLPAAREVMVRIINRNKLE